jgi:uncharacterized membrane protein
MMLSKNLLTIIAVLLCTQASILFGNTEKELTKKAKRTAAAANVLKTQLVEDEIVEEDEEKNEIDEEVAEIN